jgi:hypothetical protein
MRRIAFLAWPASAAILLAAVAGPASAAGEGRIITLTGAEDVSQAAAVNSAIDAASQAVAACMKASSMTAVQCECRSRSEMARLRSAYEAAVADHPEWPQPDTTVWWSGTALNFSAIKRELGLCPR